MIQQVASFFDKLMRRYTPNSFVLALFLTETVVFFSLAWTHFSPQEIILFWGNGFWELMPFTMQMIMIFLGGYILAETHVFRELLAKITQRVSCPHKAVLVVSLVSCCACLVNWAFGLVLSSLLCRAFIRALPQANFRLMVASAYAGFLLFHGGFSGSIPLIVATKGSFSEPLIGYLIPLSETLFSASNIFIVVTLLVVLPLLSWYLSVKGGLGEESIDSLKDHPNFEETFQKKSSGVSYKTPAERMENSRLLSLVPGLMGIAYIGILLYQGTFSLGLNSISFGLLFLSLAFHKNIQAFLKAADHAIKGIGPIVLQFPFYAGITGIIRDTNLVSIFGNWLTDIASTQSFDLISFYLAGFLTLFVPSGGGLWVIEAPLVIKVAKALKCSLPRSCMAVAWGDAWAHMIQPFWALPVLTIAKLKLSDIMGYCVVFLLVSGVIISLGFILF